MLSQVLQLRSQALHSVEFPPGDQVPASHGEQVTPFKKEPGLQLKQSPVLASQVKQTSLQALQA